MRVLHVHWTALPTTGGVEVHIHDLALQLRALGIEADIAHGTQGASGIYDPALDIHSDTSDPDGLAGLAAEYDVVQIHNPQWHKPEVARRLVHLLSGRTSVLADVHNIDGDPEKFAILGELGIPVVVHSEFIERYVRRHVPDARVTVLPLALDLRQAPYPIRRKGFTLLQPTRLCEWKGSHLSLTAVMDLLDEGLDLSLIHAGSKNLIWPTGLRPEVLTRMEPWKAEGRIRFVQYTVQESWSAFDQVDTVVHPTIHSGPHGEPFSLSAAQALIRGVPIIASRSGYVPQLLEGYGPKMIVPPNDLHALREAIRSFVLEGPPLLGVGDVVLAHKVAQGLENAGRTTAGFYAQLAESRMEANLDH